MDEKDRLEKLFYDEEAETHLNNFNEELYLYDPNESMPLSHKFFYKQLENIENKKILDIGCGYGFTAVNLAKLNAQVHSIDISTKMIELTRRNAEFNNVSNMIETHVMSAQTMNFDDNTFDYVVGLNILHHLNIETSSKEIWRVLKPAGKVIFLEPRIPFKLFFLIRSVIPVKCLESPGGAQLTDKEISNFGQKFKNNQINYFYFLRKLARLPIFKKWENRLDDFDGKLIKLFPWMKKLYWTFVVQFEK